MSFSAKIVADSKNEFGDRLTTFVVTFPRIILAEFNTHRMLSKNSASSRAIPFKKMCKMVMSNPFIPLVWQKDHKGMQGSAHLSPIKKWLCRRLWLLARTSAVVIATLMNKIGLSKQICNRLLEAFAWHTVIVTGTEWHNFFGLRVHPAAEVHMQEIAERMLCAYNDSIPKLLKAGEWHIPFSGHQTFASLILNKDKVAVSTVMCARTSYTIVGENQKPMDVGSMIGLHHTMRDANPKHMSPFEHCAQSMYKSTYDNDPWSGNFKGFIQYRKLIPRENIANDPRVWKS